jgi:CHAD domain-containing protein
MREFARLQTSILLRRFAFQVSRAARLGNAESVHDLRVAIRRLSRCLRAFSQFYPDGYWKRIRNRLRQLMDFAGAVRDHDIALEQMAAAGVPADDKAVAHLQTERRRALHELALELHRWKSRDFSKKWRRRLEL